MKTATKWVLHPILVAAIVFAALPFILPRIGSSASLATEIAIYALYGLGVNLLLGYTGLVSFGASAYFGAAGYAAGIAFLRLFDNMYLAIVFGTVTATVLGFILGLLILRRRGIYFSLLPRCCFGATPLVGELPRSNGQTPAWPSAPSRAYMGVKMG